MSIILTDKDVEQLAEDIRLKQLEVKTSLYLLDESVKIAKLAGLIVETEPSSLRYLWTVSKVLYKPQIEVKV